MTPSVNSLLAVLLATCCPTVVVSFLGPTAVRFFVGHQTTSPRCKQTTAATATAGVGSHLDAHDMNMIKEEPVSRAKFSQGILSLGVVGGVLGLANPQPAEAGLFGLGQNDVLSIEQVPQQQVIGTTKEVKWASVSETIAQMRAEVRERFARTGAKGGRELATYVNVTPQGADVTVGIEVETAEAQKSPALGDGFVATGAVPSPGDWYLRDEHNAPPSFGAWIGLQAMANKAGYELTFLRGIFEIYSGTGGNEQVTMFVRTSKQSW